MHDTHGHNNVIAVEGCDRCFCGCKHWRNDECLDCFTPIESVRAAENEADYLRDVMRGRE